MLSLTEFIIQWVILGGAFAGWIVFKRERFARRTRTTGTILGLRNMGDGVLAPIFSFRTINGTEIIHRSSSGRSPCPFKIGQTVEVLYDPANPNRASIDSLTQKWTAEICLGVIFSMSFVMGLLVALGVIKVPGE